MRILDRWMIFFSIMKGLRAIVVARLRIWYWHGGIVYGDRCAPCHAPDLRGTLREEFVKNSNESSNKFAPVVILNGPP